MAQRDFFDAEEQSYRELGERLRTTAGLVETLPEQEQRMAEMIARGQKPYEIAMAEGISEEAVWTFVRSLANAATVSSRGYETAGLGADTDPGVTGGYGDTGFGAIGNEGGEAVTEEPVEEK